MARNLRVVCPCCKTELQIHPVSGKVLEHRIRHGHTKPQDLDEVFERMQEKPDQQEKLFGEAIQDEKDKNSLLEDKFRRAQERAREKRDEKPPSIFDFD